MATDAPIGRIGYIIDGFTDREPGQGGGKEIRCNGCGSWYPDDLSCPFCGKPRPRFNKAARTEQLNNHLYESAARASGA